MHVLEVLNTTRVAALHPTERLFVTAARGAGLSTHRCSCGLLITGADSSAVERNHREHLTLATGDPL